MPIRSNANKLFYKMLTSLKNRRLIYYDKTKLYGRLNVDLLLGFNSVNVEFMQQMPNSFNKLIIYS